MVAEVLEMISAMKKFSTELFNGVDAFVFPFHSRTWRRSSTASPRLRSLPAAAPTGAKRRAPLVSVVRQRHAREFTERARFANPPRLPTGPMEAIAICARPSVLTYVPVFPCTRRAK